MRYLCFDIECCDGQHICEFGYVITDENLAVQKKGILLINPREKFRLTGRRDVEISAFISRKSNTMRPKSLIGIMTRFHD